MAASRERLMALLEKPVASSGLDLEDLTASNAGKRRLIRVIVDGDGGVNLDQVAEVSRAISAALDESNIMGEQPYVLEVTSPGVDRPLTAPRHWRRAIGRLVKVTLKDGSSLTGRVEASDESGADLDVALLNIDDQLRRIDLADVAKALVQVEFNRGGEDDLDEDLDEDTEEEA